jgi:palmitoyltransferase
MTFAEVGMADPQLGNGLYRPEEELTTVPLTSPRLEPPLPSDQTSAPPDHGKPSLLRRPCYYLASFVKALPVIFISGIVGWSYYAYMAAVVLTAMADHPAEQIVCAVVFHCLAVMFVWSYAMVVLTPPGSVPASWRLGPEQVQQLGAATSEEEWKRTLAGLADQLHCQVKQRSVQAAVRYCERCLAIKPDRSHHCSVCQDCTLKMDHHCPWVNNCVGFGNYKVRES